MGNIPPPTVIIKSKNKMTKVCAQPMLYFLFQYVLLCFSFKECLAKAHPLGFLAHSWHDNKQLSPGYAWQGAGGAGHLCEGATHLCQAVVFLAQLTHLWLFRERRLTLRHIVSQLPPWAHGTGTLLSTLLASKIRLHIEREETNYISCYLNSELYL